jgi:hypothetical protein
MSFDPCLREPQLLAVLRRGAIGAEDAAHLASCTSWLGGCHQVEGVAAHAGALGVLLGVVGAIAEAGGSKV